MREVDPGCKEDLRELSRLHMKLLGHGPMAQLGEFFLRRFCYTVLIEEGLLRAALFETEGRPAGFIAYTPWSITFHRRAIRKHWLYVGFLVVVSFLRDSRLLRPFVKALRLMVSRRSEITLGSDPLGEIVAIGVLPEFRTASFVRQTGLRISEELVEYAALYFRRAGIDTMRMIVEASNRPALLFYNSLGARFEPYEQMGEPMIHARFDLERQFHVDMPDIPQLWYASGNARNDDSNNDWQAYWDGLEDLPEFFRAEAADFVKRLDDVVSLGADARVLDFGCGFGFVADSLAPRVGRYVFGTSADWRRQARLVTAQHQNIGFVDLSEPTLQSDSALT
jgi:ribosomal protein S18 acetylase RimI-like enzyme